MRADQIDDQENGADQYVEAVKACRHVKGRAVCCAAKIERCMRIFIGLDHREHDAKQNGAPQAFLQPVAIPMNQRMMRPCYRRSRAEQDERIVKGELEGVHHFQTLGWELDRKSTRLNSSH